MEIRWLVCVAAAALMLPATSAQSGIFEGNGDVGVSAHPGSVQFDERQTVGLKCAHGS